MNPRIFFQGGKWRYEKGASHLRLYNDAAKEFCRRRNNDSPYICKDKL